ncbi:MAG: hydroxymethylbilane synthase [Chloroflexi bacterium]|nr:hydroxymethylbilane synthase [Chloroflexota bacterium]
MTRSPITHTIIAGARPSALAQRQTRQIIAQLQATWPWIHCETTPITTTGDRNLSQPLPEIGGKGVFTEQLEAALRAERIDFAVHSLKDLPIEEAAGLTIAAISAREDVRDVLVSGRGYTLATLPRGARVGTSSLRRAAQLAAARPDLTILPIRGNVDTRIRKSTAGDYDAVVLAAAGLARLGLLEHVAEYLSPDVMLPAPGQAALAVQCRAEDAELRRMLSAIDDARARAAVTAERSFLNALGGGCSAPVAAYAQSSADRPGWLTMRGLVAAVDGSRVIRVQGEGAEPRQLGAQLANQALSLGAGALL